MTIQINPITREATIVVTDEQLDRLVSTLNSAPKESRIWPGRKVFVDEVNRLTMEAFQELAMERL